MKIIYKDFGPVSTNGYLVIDETTGKAVIIDAPIASKDFFVSNIKTNNLQVEEIWLTHSHWDHMGDVFMLKNELINLAQQSNKDYSVNILLHPDDEYRMLKPNDYLGFPLDLSITPCEIDVYMSNKNVLSLGNLKFEVRHTPGHTEGSVCFVEHQEKVVIAGDTLFSGSIGRTDLAGGNYSQLINSIKEELLTLEDEFVVYCGHGPSTTIGSERYSNPFLVN
jgi:hydroxyacylglutathione hydrolase